MSPRPPDPQAFAHLVSVLGPAAGKAHGFASLAASFAKENHFGEAAIALAAAAASRPEVAAYHAGLGALYRRLGWLQWAVVAYETAIARGQNDVCTWTSFGETMLDLARYAEAAAALDKAIALDPEGRDPSSVRARALALKGNRDLTR